MPDETVTIECGGDEYVWDAAGCQGGWLPSICRQGRCLTCAGQLLSGEDEAACPALPRQTAGRLINPYPHADPDARAPSGARPAPAVQL